MSVRYPRIRSSSGDYVKELITYHYEFIFVTSLTIWIETFDEKQASEGFSRIYDFEIYNRCGFAM
jgi:hypothetical protein